MRAVLLLLAYVLTLMFVVLAMGSFIARDVPAAALCLALAVVSFWTVLKGEAALDAQALDEF